jgi:hypothetical protein
VLTDCTFYLRLLLHLASLEVIALSRPVDCYSKARVKSFLTLPFYSFALLSSSDALGVAVGLL